MTADLYKLLDKNIIHSITFSSLWPDPNGTLEAVFQCNIDDGKSISDYKILKSDALKDAIDKLYNNLKTKQKNYKKKLEELNLYLE